MSFAVVARSKANRIQDDSASHLRVVIPDVAESTHLENRASTLNMDVFKKCGSDSPPVNPSRNLGGTTSQKSFLRAVISS